MHIVLFWNGYGSKGKNLQLRLQSLEKIFLAQPLLPCFVSDFWSGGHFFLTGTLLDLPEPHAGEVGLVWLGSMGWYGLAAWFGEVGPCLGGFEKGETVLLASMAFSGRGEGEKELARGSLLVSEKWKAGLKPSLASFGTGGGARQGTGL